MPQDDLQRELGTKLVTIWTNGVEFNERLCLDQETLRKLLDAIIALGGNHWLRPRDQGTDGD